MDNLNLALDGVCWRFPDGLVALQTSVYVIFGGIEVSKRLNKTRQSKKEDSWGSPINSERLSVLEYVFKKLINRLDFLNSVPSTCWRGLMKGLITICWIKSLKSKIIATLDEFQTKDLWYIG
jgi:hypothetical protein